ncbi:MAG: hypothetical protein CBB71_20415 [Rhodopirellula sp. TMED11]|nr:MAG: hypothetical protein CBB71_20415 [Rhodopirellula sp. TMED11]
MMKEIVIVGYPKSGTTWISRLVAELVGCPVTGFLGSDHKEIAQEGPERESEFQCLKSHHQLHELEQMDLESKKIIYVMRDPRDICLSGTRYFRFHKWARVGMWFDNLPKSIRSIYRLLNRTMISDSFKLERMSHAVLYGAEDVHHWVRVPWSAHCQPYVDAQHFILRYEDLLSNPEAQCKRVVEYLGIERSESHLCDAIEKQSFANKKKEFAKSGKRSKAKFLRKGKKEQWKAAFSPVLKQSFESKIGRQMKQHGY